jgi:hypothetical protein
MTASFSSFGSTDAGCPTIRYLARPPTADGREIRLRRITEPTAE